MTLLWKLLRSHLSVAQTVGFALAGVVGMTIVLTSVQAYRDVMPVFDAPDSFMRGDYLVLSKRVGALQTIGLGSSDLPPGSWRSWADSLSSGMSGLSRRRTTG